MVIHAPVIVQQTLLYHLMDSGVVHVYLLVVHADSMVMIKLDRNVRALNRGGKQNVKQNLLILIEEISKHVKQVVLKWYKML
jgi:hypothetical protein